MRWVGKMVRGVGFKPTENCVISIRFSPRLLYQPSEAEKNQEINL
jgi:hypothetical protein